MRIKFQRGFGWIPDLPDQRDHLYAAPGIWLAQLPPTTNLRHLCPTVYDQGNLGSCTANAIAAAIEFDQMKEGLPDVFTPSRLFIYYNERAMEGTAGSDSGAQIRDGIKSVGQKGDCPEREWPYIISKFAEKPTASCYKDAIRHRAVSYQRVAQNLNQMKGCLASGYPFLFGFSVYESFMDSSVGKTGHASMPSPAERCIGGHAVLAVGYDDDKKWFLVRNSWGSQWGMHGYFTLPYDYLTDHNLADDFWTIRIVE